MDYDFNHKDANCRLALHFTGISNEFDVSCSFCAFNWQILQRTQRTLRFSVYLRRTGGASIAVRKVNLPEAQIVNMG